MFFLRKALPFILAMLIVALGAFAFLSSREPPTPIVTYKLLPPMSPPKLIVGVAAVESVNRTQSFLKRKHQRLLKLSP